MTSDLRETIKSEIGGIALVALGGLIVASLNAGSGSAWMGNQAVGAIGGFLARVSLGLTGDGRYLLAGLLILMGLRAIFFPGTGLVTSRVFGMLLIYVELLLYYHLPYFSGGAFGGFLREGLAGAGGGIIGALVSSLLLTFFGQLGTRILMGAGFAISFILVTGLSFQDVASWVWKLHKCLWSKARGEFGRFLFTEVDVEDEENTIPQQYPPIIISSAREPEENDILQQPVKESKLKGSKSIPALKEILPDMEPPAGKPVTNLAFGTRTGVDNSAFIIPPLSLLVSNTRSRSSRANKDITDKVKLLEDTLSSFGVTAKVNQVSYGPTITRFELQPGPGVKVSKIQSLADDIALNLAASQVRIEAPIPGKSAVGIEVPNKEITQVSFREVLETEAFQMAPSRLTVALGKDIAGNPIVADLGKMPHLLIAGATGSGKSVCLNSLICSLLFKANPRELKMMLIDPKMVELTTFNGIPHLISPVVTNAKKAATALKWMVNEMEHRYELFAAEGMRNIENYNKLKSRESPVENGLALPYVMVIIDELADLMLVAPADVEDSICRLAQMARAAGIHLVVATQRPSVDVITGLIKANIPSRIAFAVSSQTDSRVILDTGGADKLLGKGDMLFLPIGASKPVRVQGVFVSDSEVEKTVDFWRKQGKPEFQEIAKFEERIPEGEDADDPLLAEAARVFLENGQASISMLQRRLHVGYSRAARLVDQMEQKGIVGGYEGSKPRALLIGWDDYAKIFDGGQSL